jgi:hypothetical protein
MNGRKNEKIRTMERRVQEVEARGQRIPFSSEKNLEV